MTELNKKVKPLTLWSSTLPYLVSLIVFTFAAPINTFIASGISKTSVESIGTASGVMGLFGVLLSLLTGGANILVGQYIGKKSQETLLKKATDSPFLVAMIQVAIVIAFLVPLRKLLLMAWGVEANSQQMIEASRYIMILSFSLILIQAQRYFLGIISTYGKPKITMIVGISLVLIDGTVSSLLVFVGGFGINGVIYGTVIARAFGFLVSAILYQKLIQPLWKIRSFDWVIIKKIMKISLPIAGEKMNYNLGQFVQGIIMGNITLSIGMVAFGHNYMLWARAIFGSIQALIMVGGLAMAIGMEPLVARAMGAGKSKKEINHIVYKALVTALLIDIPLTVILFFVSPYIIELLTSSESNQLAIAKLKEVLKPAFGILILLEAGRIFNLVYISAGRCAGDSKYTALMSIWVTWLTAILIAWLLSAYTDLGYMGIVIGMALDECARGVINYLRWKTGKWETKLKELHSEKKEEVVNA